MRIAYSCTDPGIPTFGRKGASVHVQEVIRAFRSLGHTVELFAARVGDDVPADLRDLRVHRLPPVPSGKADVRERAAMTSADAVYERLADAGPFDLVYERYSLWSGAGMRFARDHGVAGVLEVNAPLIAEQVAHRVLVHRDEAVAATRACFAAAGRIVAVSDGVASYVCTFAEARDKVVVVSNGVDPRRFRPLAPSDRARFTVGFVGTLKAWHGLDTLVEAIATVRPALPGVHLLVVGDGPERGALEASVDRLDLRGVTTFTGAVAPMEVPRHLRAMDVAVAPYPALDECYFSPLKVFEYLAAGVPVVASRIGQLERLLSDGETCLFTAPGSVRGLADALARARNDVALRRSLARSGLALVQRSHTWRSVASTILDAAAPAVAGRGS